MDKKEEFYLLQKAPHVLRARGFRLYLANGKRLTDLWLNGGAAILGHTPANQLREIKNTASRGLYAPYPHFTQGRYLKALSKLLPNCGFRLYAAPPLELVTHFANGNATFWRPFADTANPFAMAQNGDFHVLILPGIQTWRNFSDGLFLPLGLCVVAASSQERLTQLPPSDILPPVLLAAATRGVYDLIAASGRAKPNLPRTFKALKADNCPWQHILQNKPGIYLALKQNPTQQTWETFFNRFLEAGFLLPPTSTHPLILPDEMSDGEDAKLAGVLGC